MILRSIQTAQALTENRIKLVWADGSESVVDLKPVLAKGGVFAFLRDPAAFGTVAVGARGRTLVWRDPEGDEIDLCADALWRLAPGARRHDRSGVTRQGAKRLLIRQCASKTTDENGSEHLTRPVRKSQFSE